MRVLTTLAVLSLAAPACTSVDDPGSLDVEDGEHDGVTGKADSIAEGSRDAKLILALVNDSSVGKYELDDDVGLSTRLAESIITHRKGADMQSNTADDDLFDTLSELDAIPYLGPAAMNTLLLYARKTATTATLSVDLVAKEWFNGGSTERTVKLSDLNALIAPHGIAPFEDRITLGARDDRAFIELMDRVDLVSEKLGRSLELQQGWDPSEYVGLCYDGPLKEVGAVVHELYSSLFSEYMGIQGWRWQTFKEVFSWEGDEDAWLTGMRDELGADAEADAWESFDTASKDFLMMTDGGQEGDGTEIFAVKIPHCAP